VWFFLVLSIMMNIMSILSMTSIATMMGFYVKVFVWIKISAIDHHHELCTGETAYPSVN